jgi:hypothetical protein
MMKQQVKVGKVYKKDRRPTMLGWDVISMQITNSA